MEHETQRERILSLLMEKPGEWIPLYRILDLRIGQYGTRIKELRASGHKIENRKEWEGRSCHSWFRYLPVVYENGQRVFAGAGEK